MSGRRKKSGSHAGVDASDDDRSQLMRDAGGFDWGWPLLDMIFGEPALANAMSQGGFSGFGYGLLPEGQPFIAMLGENSAPMKTAMSAIRGWTDVFGANALRVEILFDGPGYVFGISENPRLMRWRIGGIDTVRHSFVFGASLTKRMDSRQPFLDDLAEYTKAPVAPVLLTTGVVGTSVLRSGGAVPFRPDMDSAVWLPGMDVYRDISERPYDSTVLLESEVEARRAKGGPPVKSGPEDVSRERERMLLASLPKTLHVLRHSRSAAQLFDDERLEICARWQVEQAVCNLRMRDYLKYEPKSRAKRFAMLDEARRTITELASEIVNPARIDVAAVAEQASLDAAFLLRRLDLEVAPPPGLAARVERLRELGYG